MRGKWFKHDPDDNIWWLDTDAIGEFIFSFDKNKEFNLFRDYPAKLTKKQKEVFDAENPKWADFFSDRR